MEPIHRRTFHSRVLARGSALALTGPLLRVFGQTSDPGWQPSRKYRACVIGHTGRGGYGHGLDTCFQGIPEIKIAAVADPVSEACQKTARTVGAGRTYADWREMLEREKPDLVSIGPRWVEDRVEMLSAAAAGYFGWE